MSDWRYFATRLNGDGTETVLHNDLPLSKVTITITLSGSDSLQATITPEIASMIGSDGQPIFDPWSTALYAEKDGVIRCGTILDEMVVKEDGKSLGLYGVGFPSYLHDMPWKGTYSKVNIDPLDIFRDIWKHVQSQPRGNLGLTIDTSVKTPVRLGYAKETVKFRTENGEDVEFDAGPFKLDEKADFDLSSVVSDLVKATPFDYKERHYWSGNTIKHALDLGALGSGNRLGSRRSDLRFVVGENIAILPDTLYLGDEYASEVWALGAGNGAKMIMATVARPAEKRLRRVKVVQNKTHKTKKQARDYADAVLRNSLGYPEVDDIKVWDHPHARLGSWAVGDEILIQSSGGWAGNLDLWARVVSYTITPDDETVSTLSVVRVDRI